MYDHASHRTDGIASRVSLFSVSAQFCSGASWLGPLFQALPYVWRFCQCIRVVLDTGADAQRWNALKYATAFPAIVCWGMRPRVGEDEWCAAQPCHGKPPETYWWGVREVRDVTPG